MKNTKAEEILIQVEKLTRIKIVTHETMASKKPPPKTAKSAAAGLVAHMVYQAATLQPNSNTTPPATNTPSSSLTTSNVAQSDVDDVSGQEWQTRVQQWRSQTQKAPETEGELEDEAEGQESTSADASATGSSVPTAASGSKSRRAKAKPLPKSSGDRLLLWGKTFAVPSYSSWSSSNSPVNKYQKFYTYGAEFRVASGQKVLWNWSFESLENSQGLRSSVTPGPGHFPLVKSNFATEHVLEIQMVSQFLAFVNPNQKAQTALLNKAYVQSSKGIVGHAYGLRTASALSPAEFLAAALPKDDEFVYLQSEVNTIKMVYFSMGRPAELQTKFKATVKSSDYAATTKIVQEILTKMTMTALLASYMNDATVQKIYVDVRTRIRDVLRDLDNAGDGTYRTAVGVLNLPTAWTLWHHAFIELIENNMQECIKNGFATLDNIRKQIAALEPRTERAKALGQETTRQALATLVADAITAMNDAKSVHGLDNISLQALNAELPATMDMSRIDGDNFARGNRSGPRAPPPLGPNKPEDTVIGDISTLPQVDSDEEREEPGHSNAISYLPEELKGKAPKKAPTKAPTAK